ncbi:MAG: hypothetical protein EXS49_00055 [Candidatus Pacebacteria bacterium]|nr:hypothetical protein [Candidatus Paceibacterota bacterium]
MFKKIILLNIAILSIFFIDLNQNKTLASFPGYCSSEIIIFAQDIDGVTPGNNNDTAIVNNRNGARLATINQVSDDYIVFPNDYYIKVYSGERAVYAGAQKANLTFEIVDNNYALLNSYSFGVTNSNRKEVQINQDGYIHFIKNFKSNQSSWIIICPKSNSNPPPTSNGQITWSQIPTQYVNIGSVLQFNISANSSIGKTISYTAVNLAQGASFDSNTMQFSWTPTQSGTYSVTFRASDGINSTDMTVSIIVNGTTGGGCYYSCNNSCDYNNNYNYSGSSILEQYDIFGIFGNSNNNSNYGCNNNCGYSGNCNYNDNNNNGSYYQNYNIYAPNWNIIPTQTGYAGQLLRFVVFATSQNNSNLSYSAFNLPSGASFDSVTRTFSWVPGFNQIGTYHALFRVTDGSSASQDMNITINILNSGQAAPSFTVFDPPLTGVENQSWTYTAQAVSNGGGGVVYRLLTAPAGMTISQIAGTINWIPNSSQGRPNPYLVTVGASSGYAEATRSFYLTIADTDGNYSIPYIPPYQGSGSGIIQKPNISNININNIDGGIRISWSTDIPAKGRVVYGRESQANKGEPYSYSNATNYSEVNKDNSVNLTGLEDNKTYYLRIVADASGAVSTSQEISYVYLAASGAGLGFALASLGALIANGWFWLIAILAIGIFYVYPKFSKKTA